MRPDAEQQQGAAEDEVIRGERPVEQRLQPLARQRAGSAPAPRRLLSAPSRPARRAPPACLGVGCVRSPRIREPADRYRKRLAARRVVAEHVPRLRSRRQQDRVPAPRKGRRLCYRLVHDSSVGAAQLRNGDIGRVSRECSRKSGPVGADQHGGAQPRRRGRDDGVQVSVGCRGTTRRPPIRSKGTRQAMRPRPPDCSPSSRR